MSNRKNYAQMSPQERNAELCQLYDQLPMVPDISDLSMPQGPEGLPQALEITKRAFSRFDVREKSEHRELLLKKVRQLLVYAKVSPYFRKNLEWLWGVQYQIGIPKERPTDITLYCVLDTQFPNSGGIFYSRRAKEIERVVYQQELAEYFEIETKHSKAGDAEINKQISNIRKHLGEWRRAFMQHHGEEP